MLEPIAGQLKILFGHCGHAEVMPSGTIPGVQVGGLLPFPFGLLPLPKSCKGIPFANASRAGHHPR